MIDKTCNDWKLGFIPLRDKSHNVIAARCKVCEKVLQQLSIDKLNEHRSRCKRIVTDNMHLSEIGEAVGIGQSTTNSQEELFLHDDEELTVEDLNEKLTEFFCACNIPYRVVEDKYFLNFVEALRKTKITKYKPPCRQTLASTCVNELHEKIVNDRKKKLRGTDSVLLIDGWKNSTINRKIVVCSLRNENISHTFLKAYDASLEREDGEYLSEVMVDAIDYAKEFYETDVFAIKSDNDAKILRGGRLAESSAGETLWHSTCASHSANLLLKSLVPSTFSDNMREVIHAFREPKLDSLVIKYGGTLLRNYPDTRFAYLRDSAVSILNNIDILIKISTLENVNIKASVLNIINNDVFTTQLTDLIDLLEPVCKLIYKAQDPVCNAADTVQLWLSLRLHNIQQQELLKDRILRALKPVDFAAYVLHHKYAGSLLSPEQNQKAYQFFRNTMDSQTLEELHEYLENKEELLPLQARCRKPIVYWKLSKAFFPNLAKYAIKLLLIPASTAQLEAYFSQWTYVHNIYRNRLTQVNSRKLVDVYSSLRSQNKY
ncbi:uncharacterized protein LOC106639719 [Copidosoma floridanum]|uniref:uncharacterized protein LOC106639719 n=1 Tax=Copidosoma floridanum TaxID=29053 RepID=UPI0006C95175|nr:uncharacterized protein LOC106639719 [Copidosoma floridanum]XP_014208961.1 uncharacterized protein LOC106639719 [Copidosoma floridanum]